MDELKCLLRARNSYIIDSEYHRAFVYIHIYIYIVHYVHLNVFHPHIVLEATGRTLYSHSEVDNRKLSHFLQ